MEETEVGNPDGELARAVDFDALRDLLGDVAEGQRERYQFTWPGKREAKAEARRPIYKTMILPRRAASTTPRAATMTRRAAAWSPTPRATAGFTRTGAR